MNNSKLSAVTLWDAVRSVLPLMDTYGAEIAFAGDVKLLRMARTMLRGAYGWPSQSCERWSEWCDSRVRVDFVPIGSAICGRGFHRIVVLGEVPLDWFGETLAPRLHAYGRIEAFRG